MVFKDRYMFLFYFFDPMIKREIVEEQHTLREEAVNLHKIRASIQCSKIHKKKLRFREKSYCLPQN